MTNPRDRRKKNVPVSTERRDPNRKTGACSYGIDEHGKKMMLPTTSDEVVYGDDEVEFMKAMEDYKHKNRRPFPSWREVFHVLLGLGYRKCSPAPPVMPGPPEG